MSTKLRALREELKLTQEQLARKADLTQTTYRAAEIGQKRVRYSTAKRILDALNEERQGRQLPALTLDDLGLALF